MLFFLSLSFRQGPGSARRFPSAKIGPILPLLAFIRHKTMIYSNLALVKFFLPSSRNFPTEGSNFYFAGPYNVRLQARRLSSTSMGKISSRPKSMSSDKTILDKSL